MWINLYTVTHEWRDKLRKWEWNWNDIKKDEDDTIKLFIFNDKCSHTVSVVDYNF